MGFLDLFKQATIEEMQAKRNVGGLIKALRNQESSLRAKAATALGTLKDKKSIEALMMALRDSIKDVRVAAEDALASFGDPVLRYIAELPPGRYYMIEVKSSSGNAYGCAADIRDAAGSYSTHYTEIFSSSSSSVLLVMGGIKTAIPIERCVQHILNTFSMYKDASVKIVKQGDK